MNISLPDGKILDLTDGATALDGAAAISRSLAASAIAAKINGAFRDLSSVLQEGDRLEMLTFDSPEGKSVFWHSSSHILAQAVQELFPSAKVAIGPSIDNGFYYDFDVERPFSPDDLAAIEARAREIAGRKLPIERFEPTLDEARGYFESKNEPYKIELLKDIDGSPSMYRQGVWQDLCRGPHVPNTGCVKAFKILSTAGAYWRGSEKNKMLQRIYAISFPKESMLKEYLQMIEEAAKRDHRRLGNELDLFSMNEAVGPGLVLWHPRGGISMLKPGKAPFQLDYYWQQLRKPLELEIAHGCPDTAIAGAGIGVYSRLWAERIAGGAEEDVRLALSIARGLRDYVSMPVSERKRRAMAAIDLLRQREENQEHAAALASVAVPKPAAASPVKRSEKRETKRAAVEDTLPTGKELLEMPIQGLAPRARWPRQLANKNIYTVRDLLYYIPRDWLEISAPAALADDTRAAVVGTVERREYVRLKSKYHSDPLFKYTITLADEQVEVWVTSITSEPERGSGKRPWSPSRLPFQVGTRIFVLGKVERIGKIIVLRMEDIFQVTAAEESELRPGALVPLYPLTEGVYQSQVHRAVLRALQALGAGETANALVDPLPRALREEYGLLPLIEALQELHHPSNPQRHELARKRLAFEEFLAPQLILLQRRRTHSREQDGIPVALRETLVELTTRLASFALTPAQVRVLGEIEADLRQPRAMNRLLHGDVGSGKTLVAAGALAGAIRAGCQAAMMAPTEILAEQLFLVLSHLLAPLKIAPVLLTGSVSGAERQAALAALANGVAPLAVGTHALIQEGVNFANLGLTIVDEQHRFGVLQRATLRGKGRQPHALVMTATPIPRTLSLTLFGDLDISVLDALPPGRHPVDTRWLSVFAVREAYELIRAEVAAGRQAYVLCPLVEQSELLQADAAIDMAVQLRRLFPALRVGLLHGRQRPEEKDAEMEAFRGGQTQLLACTTVIEVGVDVPNATVIVIHNAERFGLAQLHQLRGRVGRAEHPSTCFLVTQPRFNPALQDGEDLPARRRLRTMLEQQDGFAIAEADLELRGPGEYLGTQQSGLFDFTIGSLVRDGKYLEQARQAAADLLRADPALTDPAHAELRRRVQSLKVKWEQYRE